MEGKIYTVVIVIGCTYQENQQADRPCLLTEEVRFQLRDSTCDICGGHSGGGSSVFSL